MAEVKILFLAANPLETSPLRINEETRVIDDALRSADFRDNFEVRQYLALRYRDLQELLLRYKPDIVHFSGHGNKAGEIIIQSDTDSSHPISARSLGQLFGILKDNIRCVVLNACYSEPQAQAIAQNIDVVVGMTEQISDIAAINFSSAFYQALGFGRSVKTAFDLACNQIDLTNLDEQNIPQLIALRTDPNRITFLLPTRPFTPNKIEPAILYETNKPSKNQRCDFYQHISLPQNYQHRSNLLTDLYNVLSVESNAYNRLSVPKIHALHGMGGIGKSVIARALCDNPNIQFTFPDGILWVTLGKTPNIEALLYELITALGGSITEVSPSIDKLKNNLAKLLADRACLFILDDVWRRSHAEPFIAGGPRCCFLLTTRDAEIAKLLGAHIHSIPLMEEEHALELLNQWAGASLQTLKHEIKVSIVNRLEHLPLGIRLAGAQLRYKNSDLWLQTFDARKLKSRRIEEIHDSLSATFALSLEDLDSSTRNLYLTLGVFPPDEKIPRIAICKLWAELTGLIESEIDEVIYDLNSRALLQVIKVESNDNLAGKSIATTYNITIHSLLRDFLLNELAESVRIQSHQAILNAYRNSSPHASWSEILDDGYLYEHLIYHLDQIADHDQTAKNELIRLFDNLNWLQARLVQSSYKFNGYISDLMMVWTRVHKEVHTQLANHGVSLAIAESVRFALIRSSINSMAADYESVLVARAVELGVWSIERSLDLVQNVHSPFQRVKLISAVLSTNRLQYTQQKTVLKLGVEAVNAIKDDYIQFDALISLFPYLAIEEKRVCQTKLCKMLISLQDIDIQLQIIKLLAAHLVDEANHQITSLLLNRILAISDDQACTQRLLDLAPVLNQNQLSKVLTLAYSGGSGNVFQTKLLVGLLPYLKGEQKYQAFQQGLQNALSLISSLFRAQLLIELIPHAEGETRQEVQDSALHASLAIEDSFFRAQSLAKLGRYLSGSTRQFTVRRSFEATLGIELNWPLTNALVELLPYLDGEEKHIALTKATESAFKIKDDWYKALALVRLSQVVESPQKDFVLNKALEAVLSIRNMLEKDEIVAKVIQQLDANSVRRELETVRIPESQRIYRRVVNKLIGYLTVESLQQSFEVARSAHSEVARSRALNIVADYLPKIGKEISSSYQPYKDRGVLFDKTVIHLMPASYENNVIGQTGAADGKLMKQDLFLMEIMAHKVTYKFEGDLNSILQQVSSIDVEEIRADALVALFPRFPLQSLNILFGAILALSNRRLRAETLSKLASRWPDESNNLFLVIRSIIADHLFWDARKEQRSYLLDLFSSKELFTAPILPQDTLGVILGQIIEICEIWEWEFRH